MFHYSPTFVISVSSASTYKKTHFNTNIKIKDKHCKQDFCLNADYLGKYVHWRVVGISLNRRFFKVAGGSTSEKQRSQSSLGGISIED